MSLATRLASRLLVALTLGALLSLPTIVGARSGTVEPAPGQSEDACQDEGAFWEDAEPEPETVSACADLMPDETVPGDAPDLPPAHETRTASPDRLRAETA